jgi:hypothetical protein
VVLWFSLPLISNFIPFWSVRIQGIILIFFAFVEMCFVAYFGEIPWAAEKNV